MHQRTRLPRSDELEDLADHRIACKFALDARPPLAKNAFGEEQGVIRAPDPMNIVALEATAPHADNVETIEHTALADGEAEGNHVGSHPAHAGNHGSLADADELVDRGRATEDDVV